jgi:trehalose 6-phosphate phosphatase
VPSDPPTETAATADLDALIAPLRSNPASAAILCDVDGTLAPIVDDPEAAGVPEETREVLRRLAARYGLVGCLTGRRALDARRIVGLDEIVYAGNHGYEALRPGEDEPSPDPTIGRRVDRARQFVAGLDDERLSSVGLRREDKGAIQALHWRGAPAESAARMRAQEVATLAQSSGLVPRWGRKVLEIRPVAGIDKGSAALRLLRESGAVHALFGGDDETDLDAFQALRWMESSGRLESAVCVGVASDEQPPTLAARSQLVVDGTEGFREVLEALVI